MAAFVFAQFLNTAVVTLFNWRVPGGGPGKGPVVLMVLLPVFTGNNIHLFSLFYNYIIF